MRWWYSYISSQSRRGDNKLWWLKHPSIVNSMKTSWHENAFRITGPWWGESVIRGIHQSPVGPVGSPYKGPVVWRYDVFLAVILSNVFKISRIAYHLRLIYRSRAFTMKFAGDFHTPSDSGAVWVIFAKSCKTAFGSVSIWSPRGWF